GDNCNTFHRWRAYPGGNCGNELRFHFDSSILHFVGCGCATPGDLCCDTGSTAGPKNYCSNPYQATSRWASAGTLPHYCGCPDGPNKDYCGPYALGQDDVKGCIHAPSQPLAANTVYTCTEANDGFNARYTNARQCQTCSQPSGGSPTCTPIPPPPACG